MASVSPTPVTQQPESYNIGFTFSRMGNEVVVNESEYDEGCCGCMTKYYTTLTDARLLFRNESKTCCCRSTHYDVSYFLRDIAEIRQSSELSDNCDFCRCCVRCCRSQKILEIRGVFGSKTLHIPKEDLKFLQYEIPARAGNHKLISHR